MSSSVNKVILVGTLGRDPELKFTKGGQAVAGMSLATNERWKDKNGDKQERTEWHRIKAWGKLAELCGQYLAKGRQVYIEGKLQTQKWQDKEGRDRYTTEVVAFEVQFLGSKDGAMHGKSSGRAEASGDADYSGEMRIDDDDTPF